MRQQYPHRYAANWHQIRKATLQLTGDCCCLCATTATAVHHIRYAYWDGKKLRAIAGKERPLIDVFPLCGDCHKVAHAPHNWVWDRENPELGNHNRAEFVQRLQASLKPATRRSLEPLNEQPSWGAAIALLCRLLLT